MKSVLQKDVDRRDRLLHFASSSTPFLLFPRVRSSLAPFAFPLPSSHTHPLIPEPVHPSRIFGC
jgi:hypothetical protein